jgi:hypothetical protein
MGQFRTQHSGVAANVQLELEERFINEDKALFDRYAEEIPVLQIDGKVHGYWRIDPERLIQALEEKLSQ